MKEMLALLHGYLLEGSGSNLWTRHIGSRLREQGVSFHLFCQQRSEGVPPWISREVEHRGPTTRTVRDVPTPSGAVVTLHRVAIGRRLPVFIKDDYADFEPVPVGEMAPEEWDRYVQAHITALAPLIRSGQVDRLLINHSALLVRVGWELHRSHGIPYTVVPHGSEIEYALKDNAKLREYLREPLEGASHFFTVNQEIRDRLASLFPGLSPLPPRTTLLSVGVDTRAFRPLPPREPENWHQTLGPCHGREATPDGLVHRTLAQLPTLERYQRALEALGAYPSKETDRGLAPRLLPFFDASPTVAFAGRLLAAKGPQRLVAALPWLWQRLPSLKVVIMGHGPLREVLELWLHALKAASAPWVEGIAEWGSPRENEGNRYTGLAPYVQHLKDTHRWDSYLALAQQMPLNRILFTGYLAQGPLARILGRCQCAVFPSVVPEAGPMVLLEGAAAGCFPLGTNQAGMAENLEKLFHGLSPDLLHLAQLPVDSPTAIDHLALHLPAALERAREVAPLLRTNAIQKYDWSTLATRLLTTLESIQPRHAA